MTTDNCRNSAITLLCAKVSRYVQAQYVTTFSLNAYTIAWCVYGWVRYVWLDNNYNNNNNQDDIIVLSSAARATCESSLWVLWAKVGQRQVTKRHNLSAPFLPMRWPKPSPELNAHTHGGMARLSGPDWPG